MIKRKTGTKKKAAAKPKPARAASRKAPAKSTRARASATATKARPTAPASANVGVSANSTSAKLNDTDRQLLSLMQADARLSNLALAKAVGLSPAACHERVRKLISQGWISAFNAQLNAQALGQGLVVFVDLVLDPAEPKALEALQKVVDNSVHFMECHRVAGDSDIMLKVRCSDLETYRDILDKAIRPIRGVQSINSRVSLTTLKQSNQIAL